MFKVTTVPVKTVLSKSKIAGVDYAINPYVGCPHRCIYCYAEYMRKFTGHTEKWGDFLDVKLAEKRLTPAQLFHTQVLLSSVTDPYNPYEKIYNCTRSVLTQLLNAQAYVTILTKSSLVLRDLDLLKQLPRCQVSFSFSTAAEPLRQQLEPRASSVQERIEALRILHENQISTGVMIAPILPQLTDWENILEKTKPYTSFYRFDRLNIRSFLLPRIMDFIEINYPKLFSLYTDIFVKEQSSYYPQLAQQIRHFCTQ